MPYVDADGGKRRWVSERDTHRIHDQVRKAAEVLAEDVETYLYDESSGVWMKPEFLAWAVARYDILKTGSGDYAQMKMEYDPEEAANNPLPPPSTTVTPYQHTDIAVRYPAHAVEAGFVPVPDGDDD
jgi:hypothetical protein